MKSAHTLLRENGERQQVNLKQTYSIREGEHLNGVLPLIL